MRAESSTGFFEVSGTATSIALLAICVVSISIRLFPVVLWGSVIHEFDPHFNFRVTKFLAQYGVVELLNWFDDRAWYPLGRIVGTTVYPGLMAASAIIYWIAEFAGIPIEIRHVCVFIAPLFSAFSSLALYLLTKEVTGKTTTALLAAMLLGVCPAYISRSTAGSFDNEGIAIFLLILTFYLWIKAAHTGSMLWAGITALSYFGMVLSWGGYVFIINVIPIHVLVLVLSGRYSSRVYIAYSTFYPLAVLLSMQVPFVGFNAVLKGENAAAHGMFALLQAVAFLKWLQVQLSAERFGKLLQLFLAIGVAIAGTALIGAFALGKLQWSGRSLTLLDPTYASKYIPIIASVGEHQPTVWSGFYLSLGPVMVFSPLGMYYSFQKLNSGFIFMIVYSIFALYFSGIMVRLLLTLAPAACFLSAVGISMFMERVAEMTRSIAADPSENEKQTTPERTEEEEEKEYEGETLKALSVKLRFTTPPKGMKTHLRGGEVPGAIGLLLLAICLLLVVHVRHSVNVSRKAYSSTSLVYESWNATTQERTPHDDYREAYMWLRQNTPEDAKILSWWDYGYQISSLANRTVIVDNNTWNNTHIATVGRVLTSTEEDALPILESLDVDYILILFGGKIGMSGDDLDKLPWIIRITEGVFPDTTIESEFQVNGRYLYHENSTSAMTSSLLYKFSFADFSLVEDYSNPNTTTFGMDRNRRNKVASEISLKHFEQVFTSESWIVRIYQVKGRR
ncbi:Dolichyl-diphosphooligosaccharide-protein glycosyltransferase, partial [Globisporangium splendens]